MGKLYLFIGLLHSTLIKVSRLKYKSLATFSNFKKMSQCESLTMIAAEKSDYARPNKKLLGVVMIRAIAKKVSNLLFINRAAMRDFDHAHCFF